MPSKRREFSLSGELKVSDVVEVSFLISSRARQGINYRLGDRWNDGE
jgi:hypothetical protein